MVRSHPIELEDGDFLLPVYSEKGNDTESVGAESTSLFLHYDANGSLVETNQLDSRSVACNQPLPEFQMTIWFVTTDVAATIVQKLVALSFVPSHVTEGRFGHKELLRNGRTPTRRSNSSILQVVISH